MTTRSTLSVCVITCNEEANIRACLDSVAWADERIVVDSHSADRTVEIARQMGARVVLHPFEGHLQQKNFALDQATGDWALSIDADERVTPELAEEIRAAVAGAGPEVAYSMPRKSWYLGQWILHGGWYPDRKLRLARRGKARWSGTNPHDHLYADGPTGELRGDLVHYTYRDISDHLRKIDAYTSIAAREMAARGVRHPLLRMLLHPPMRLLRMYLLKAGFLDGQAGFVLAALSGYYVFLKYAKLWELARRKTAGGPEARA
jgi:glycosyltransferase involved in cell wall biosynthesis